MTWGLCLLDADDAVREGDGSRLMNVYEMFQLLFRMMGNTKYSYSLLRLKACRLALLTPKMAHQLIWNRFFNRTGGEGMNISRDLRLEHINRFMKELIKSQGMQNISDTNVYKISKAYKGVREICDSMLLDIDVSQPSGHHSNKHKNDMFESVLKELKDNNNFSTQSNKPLTTQFKKLQENRSLNLKTMVPWIKGHKRLPWFTTQIPFHNSWYLIGKVNDENRDNFQFEPVTPKVVATIIKQVIDNFSLQVEFQIDWKPVYLVRYGFHWPSCLGVKCKGLRF